VCSSDLPLVQIGLCRPTDVALLRLRDRFLGTAKARTRARLHLGKHDLTAAATIRRLPTHEIELGPLKSVVAVEYDVAASLQVGSRQLLASVSRVLGCHRIAVRTVEV